MVFSLRAQTPPVVQTFFQGLPQRFATSGRPSPEEMSRVSDQLANMPATELAKTLPAVVAALENPDEGIKSVAASALFAVSRRQDSGSLLAPYEESIVRLFDSSSERLQGMAALTFLNLKSRPPEAVLSAMLVLLNRTDREPKQQTAVLGVLAAVWPERPDVIDAINSFMSRRLDSDARVEALKAIRLSRLDDYQIRRTVTAALDDSQVEVKFAAIQVLE